MPGLTFREAFPWCGAVGYVMNLRLRIAALLFLLCLVASPFAAAATSLVPSTDPQAAAGRQGKGATRLHILSTPPLGERWFGISLADERTGFYRSAIVQTEEGYEIAGSGSVKMLVLGFSRQASSRETYRVNRDLSLKSFDVEQTIDGSPMRLTGKATAAGVTVRIESAGSQREKVLKSKGPVYPPAVLNLLPLTRGVAPGKKYRIPMLDVEEVKIKEVTITALGQETLPGGTEAIHFRNDLYPFVDNDVWVDLAGNTVRESVRDGLIVTSAEDGAVTRQFILDAAIAKRDLILDFSLIRVDRPIARPFELKKLALEMVGIPETVPLLSDGRQTAVRLEGGKVLFTVDNSANAAAAGGGGAGSPVEGKDLEPTDRILSGNDEIAAAKNEILGGEKDPLKAVQTLTRWIAANIGESVTDSHTSLEVLRNRKGNCQSHARLYTALARAAGIPTRFVSGIVYVDGKGFLYHSWAESYAGRWLAVDPTFGQVPADATHVKLAEGDSPGEMAAIAGMVGRVQGKIVEEKY